MKQIRWHIRMQGVALHLIVCVPVLTIFYQQLAVSFTTFLVGAILTAGINRLVETKYVLPQIHKAEEEFFNQLR